MSENGPNECYIHLNGVYPGHHQAGSRPTDAADNTEYRMRDVIRHIGAGTQAPENVDIPYVNVSTGHQLQVLFFRSIIRPIREDATLINLTNINRTY